MKSYCLVASNYPPDIGGPAKFASTFPQSRVGISGCVVTTTSKNFDTLEFAHHKVIRISRNQNVVMRFLNVIWQIRKNTSRGCTAIIANGFFIETYFASILSNREYVAKIPGDLVWEKAKNSGLTTSNILDFQEMRLPVVLKILRYFNSKSIQRARIVICPTSELATIVEFWGVSPAKIKIIPNSVDTKVFSPNKLVNKDIDVLCVNRLVEWKGLSEVIEACAYLDLKLVIAGSGPLLEELSSRSNQLGTSVEFLGDVSNTDLVKFYRRAHFYVLNSTYEATAYSLLEAMACGAIPIARINTGSAEVIQQNISGLLVGGHNYPNLKSALGFLISNRETHQAMSFAAISRVASEFDITSNFEKISNVLFNL